MDAEKNFTKFSAAVRGFGVAGEKDFDKFGKATNVTALGLAALNNPLSKAAGSLVIFSNGIIMAVGGALTFGKVNLLGAFNGLEGLLSKINPQFATLAGGIIRIAGAATAIFLLVEAFKAVKDTVSETGETIKAGLGAEISKRQEAILAIEKQRESLGSVEKASSRLAKVNITSLTQAPELRDEAIRQGSFKSPLLEQQRFNEIQRQSANNIGFSNPELISGFDEFGNVVLKSADAFDQLSQSIGGTEKKLLALTKIKVIEGFIKDLQPASGGKAFFGTIIRGVGDVISAVTRIDDV